MRWVFENMFHLFIFEILLFVCAHLSEKLFIFLKKKILQNFSSTSKRDLWILPKYKFSGYRKKNILLFFGMNNNFSVYLFLKYICIVIRNVYLFLNPPWWFWNRIYIFYFHIYIEMEFHPQWVSNFLLDVKIGKKNFLEQLLQKKWKNVCIILLLEDYSSRNCFSMSIYFAIFTLRKKVHFENLNITSVFRYT